MFFVHDAISYRVYRDTLHLPVKYFFTEEQDNERGTWHLLWYGDKEIAIKATMQLCMEFFSRPFPHDLWYINITGNILPCEAWQKWSRSTVNKSCYLIDAFLLQLLFWRLASMQRREQKSAFSHYFCIHLIEDLFKDAHCLSEYLQFISNGAFVCPGKKRLTAFFVFPKLLCRRPRKSNRGVLVFP